MFTGKLILPPDLRYYRIKKAILLQNKTRLGVNMCILLQYHKQTRGLQVVYFNRPAGNDQMPQYESLLSDEHTMQPLTMLTGPFNRAYFTSYDENTGY